MEWKHNSRLTKYSRDLRRNMTEEERKLWYEFLCSYPVRFLRQKVIGNYIADFYCSKAKLVIELDGSQHYSDEGVASDEQRTKYFELYNIKVLRILNSDIHNNFNGVCQYIDLIVQQRINSNVTQPK